MNDKAGSNFDRRNATNELWILLMDKQPLKIYRHECDALLEAQKQQSNYGVITIQHHKFSYTLGGYRLISCRDIQVDTVAKGNTDINEKPVPVVNETPSPAVDNEPGIQGKVYFWAIDYNKPKPKSYKVYIKAGELGAKTFEAYEADTDQKVKGIKLINIKIDIGLVTTMGNPSKLGSICFSYYDGRRQEMHITGIS